MSLAVRFYGHTNAQLESHNELLLRARLFESRLALTVVKCCPKFLILLFKSVTAAILRDNLKAAKAKLLSENNLLESTSLWIKSELKIDACPGLV